MEEGRVFQMVGSAIQTEWKLRTRFVRDTCRLAAFDGRRVQTGIMMH